MAISGSSNVDILQNTFSNNDASGLSLGECDSIFIENNFANSNGSHGFALNDISSCTFEGNEAENNVGKALQLWENINTSISNNRFINGQSSGVGVQNSNNIHFQSNLLANNNSSGIAFFECANLLIDNNIIGLDENGVALANNNGYGLYFSDCDSVHISGNMVGGNKWAGIGFGGSPSQNIAIVGNHIGLNVNGMATPNNGVGIGLGLATDALIQNNVVGGNTGTGINVGNGSAFINLLGNRIGVNANDAPTPNTLGISIMGGSHNITVGSAEQPNIIAYNSPYYAMWIKESSYDCKVSQNKIYCNDFGIILDEATSNNGILKPNIQTVNSSIISGTSAANDTIELFTKDETDCGCQGKTYIGTAYANAMGNWSIPSSLAYGDVVTATATNGHNTSEFANCKVNYSTRFKAKAWLQGAYKNGSMSSAFLQESLLPLVQPYGNAPWSYGENLLLENIPENAIDWVLVEVLDISFNSIERRAGFLDQSGNLLDMRGHEGIQFDLLNESEEYYFIIRHRNHLDVMSNAALSLNNDIPYDFTNPALVMDGNEQLCHLGNGQYGLCAGDTNGDGVISVMDYNALLPEMSLMNQYLQSDYNLDGNATVNDYNLLLQNSSKVGVIYVRY